MQFFHAPLFATACKMVYTVGKDQSIYPLQLVCHVLQMTAILENKRRTKRRQLKKITMIIMSSLFGLCQHARSTLFLKLQSRNNFTVFIRFFHICFQPVELFENYPFLHHQFNFKICCQSCEVIFPPKTFEIEKQKTYDCLEYKVLTTTPQSLNSNG